MTENPKAKPAAAQEKSPPPTKNQQVIDLLSRQGGTTLDEMSTLANWLTHSTRSFLTGLKKKEHVIESDKIDGVRRYRIVPSGNE